MKNPRQEATQLAQKIIAKKPVFLDTETTGTESSDQIVEISIVDWDGSVLLDSLTKPTKRISPGASKVHGINDILLINAPTWPQIWSEVQDALNGRVLAIYNAKFDLRMMQQTCAATDVHWHPPYAEDFCVMELFAQYFGEINPRFGSFKWKSLDFAGKYFELPEANSHRALPDTQLTRLVLEKIAEGEDLQIS
ncbi:MAG: 3'-5' exonuclease [Chloroflexi bacterium]|nr:3'-5' exonuclease [Chloroflexota bacterium]